MIWESAYWKDDLLKIARRMSRRTNQQRWTERARVNVEKDVFLAFYIIRKLIEAKKLTTVVENLSIELNIFPTLGKAVHLSNWHKIDKLYNLCETIRQKRKLQFVCNQIVHSYVFSIATDEESGGLAGVLFCSDKERNKYLYSLSAKTMIDVFEQIGNNDQRKIRMIYDDRYQDWKVWSE